MLHLLHIPGDGSGGNIHGATQVAVLNDDVYVAGYNSLAPYGYPSAYYWKNGTAVKLSNDDYSTATGIVAVAY